MDRSVFISYARIDRVAVQRDADLLRAGGVQVFIDVRDIEFGERWRDVLMGALQQCERVLVFWSRAAQMSEWVEREWRIALELGKKIVPTLLDATPLPAELAEFQAVQRFKRAAPRGRQGSAAAHAPVVQQAPSAMAAPPLPQAPFPSSAPQSAARRGVGWVGAAAALVPFVGLGLWWMWRPASQPPVHVTPAPVSLPASTPVPLPGPTPLPVPASAAASTPASAASSGSWPIEPLPASTASAAPLVATVMVLLLLALLVLIWAAVRRMRHDRVAVPTPFPAPPRSAAPPPPADFVVTQAGAPHDELEDGLDDRDFVSAVMTA